jgi:hypothetical protein
MANPAQDRTFQEVIEGWERSVTHCGEDRALAFGSCAEEARSILERLKALIADWRDPKYTEYLERRGCANELSAILFPKEQQ